MTDSGGAEGLSRDEAGALALEVCGAVGYRGEVLRLVGTASAADGWAVRVRAVVAGGARLVRSRAAWERFQAESGERVQRMNTALATAAAQVAHRPPAAPVEAAQAAQAAQEPQETLLPQGANGHAPGAPVGAGATPLARWQEATEGAIAEAEHEAGRLLARATRDRERARELEQHAILLRRALRVVGDGTRAPSAGGVPGPMASHTLTPTLRARVLDWGRAHDDALVVAACAEGLNVTLKRVSDAAGQLREEGFLERLGKGQYRLLAHQAQEAPTEPRDARLDDR